jgi:hypothetical protein
MVSCPCRRGLALLLLALVACELVTEAQAQITHSAVNHPRPPVCFACAATPPPEPPLMRAAAPGLSGGDASPSVLGPCCAPPAPCSRVPHAGAAAANWPVWLGQAGVCLSALPPAGPGARLCVRGGGERWAASGERRAASGERREPSGSGAELPVAVACLAVLRCPVPARPKTTGAPQQARPQDCFEKVEPRPQQFSRRFDCRSGETAFLSVPCRAAAR